MNAKIRAEGMERSQVMRIEQVLTDVYGPRITGSPNLENAGKWAVKEMESWGLKNGKLEPWNWGHEGWLNESAVGYLLTPVRDNLVFEVLAWTPSTKGTVRSSAVNLITPMGPAPAPAPGDPAAGGGRGAAARPGPTQAELDAYFAQMAPKVKGAVVLVGAPTVPAFVETEGPKRRADDAAKTQYTADLNAPPGPGRGNRAGGAGAGRGGGAAADPTRLSTQQVASQFADFSSRTARRFASTTPRAATARSSPSTRPATTRRKPTRFQPSCSATKTTVASRACSRPTSR
jgi:hypothetical protein